MPDQPQTTDGCDDPDCEYPHCLCGVPPPKTTRDEWFGRLQSALVGLIDEAPDETCRTMARNFLQETYGFTDDC
jgi:hypothetical protein